MAIPKIKPPLYAYAQVGLAFQFRISAFGTPTSFGATGLPAGLTINTTTGIISGTPTLAGDVNSTISASNTDGTDTRAFVFHVIAANVPFYTGRSPIDLVVGDPITALILLWNNSPTNYTVQAIPAGLSLDAATGIISGTPTVASNDLHIIQATNANGTGESVLQIRIQAIGIPVINSPLTANGQVGVPFQYRITTVNDDQDTFGLQWGPVQFVYPPGLLFNQNGGTINWTPQTAGEFDFVISAANVEGTDTKTLVVMIAPADGGGGGGGGGGETIDASGGLTFGVAKDQLRMVTDNGVDASDPRVMIRTNQATQELLTATDPRTNGRLVPVGCMIRAVVASALDPVDGVPYILLPAQIEVVYSARPLPPGNAYETSDISQSWYSITDQFTYVNPNAAHDNPLIDLGLVPDPVVPSILRRKMSYPGLSPGALVSIVGKKRYRPIVADTDYLIIQNVPALSLMIQAIEYRENRAKAESDSYRASAIQMLSDEVYNYIMDPTDLQRRRANYERDLITFPVGTKGWMRARIALEQPGGQMLGKIELDRLIEQAEMVALELGTWKGTIEEFNAEIAAGVIFMPARVESIIAISLDGRPQPVRSIFFNYLQTGPEMWDTSCGGYVRDLGEELIGGVLRHKYGIKGSYTTGQFMKAVCKLRWLPKQPADYMVIRNVEAIRLLCDSIVLQRNEKWAEGRAARDEAKMLLNAELKQYLSGVKPVLSVIPEGQGFGDLGGVM